MSVATNGTLFTFCRRVAYAVIAVVIGIAIALLFIRAGKAGCPLGGSGCEFLAQTRYSIVLGLPLPAFLVGYYVALAGAFYFVDFDDEAIRKIAWFMLSLLGLTAVLGSLFLFGVARAEYERTCSSCLVVFGANVVLGGLIYGAAYEDFDEILPIGQWAACTLVAIALPAAAAVGLAHELEGSPRETKVSASNAMPVHFRSPVVGTLLDPSCDVCALKWPELKKALSRLEARGATSGTAVQLLPADEECLEHVGVELSTSRTGACRAAVHVYCAGLQGKSIEYLDLLYSSNRVWKGADFLARWSAADYSKVEASISIDVALQAACTGDSRVSWGLNAMPDAYRNRFLRHLRDSISAGTHTPRLLVGGQAEDFAASDATGIERQIDSMLSRRSK